MNCLTPAQLAAWLADPQRQPPLLLDVREEWEYEHVCLPDAHNVPLAELPALIGRADPGQPVVCICHHGMRSLQAMRFLMHHGFEQVYDLIGGIDAWALQQEPGMTRY